MIKFDLFYFFLSGIKIEKIPFKKNKSTNVHKENYYNLKTNRSIQTDQKSERNLPRQELLKTNRELSPVYFPTLKNVFKPDSYPIGPSSARNSPLNINELKAQMNIKTPGFFIIYLKIQRVIFNLSRWRSSLW